MVVVVVERQSSEQHQVGVAVAVGMMSLMEAIERTYTANALFCCHYSGAHSSVYKKKKKSPMNN